MARLRLHLTDTHGWTKTEEESVLEQSTATVETATEAYLATAPQPPEAIFDYMYATLPADLAAQRKAVVKEPVRG